jgi:hypothetical protein
MGPPRMHTFRVETLTVDDLIRHMSREVRAHWPGWNPDGPCVITMAQGRGELRIVVRKRRPTQERQPTRAKQ